MKLPKIATKKAKITTFVLSMLFILLLIGGGIYIDNKKNDDVIVTKNTSVNQPATEQAQTEPQEQSTAPQSSSTTPSTTTPSTPAQQWPVQLSTTQATSITAVVNKKHKLPSSYAPTLGPGGRLRTEAETAFNTMLAAAKTNGAPSMIYLSGYRSYAKQEQLYNNYVAQDGQVAADTYSARPGFSEHQTGLAIDIGEGRGCDLETCFENTASAKWAATNAHAYGFVVRYPKGKDAITGYQYEPWHLRYIGISEATAVYNSGKTLEEYYNIPGGGYQ